MYSQDLYKFTMSNAASVFNGTHTTKWAFKNRGNQKLGHLAGALYKAFNVSDLRANIPLNIPTSEKARSFLNSLHFHDDQNKAWQEMHKKTCDVLIQADTNNDLIFRVKGLWQESSMFEIPVLSEIQEQYSKAMGWINDPVILAEGRKRLVEKVGLYNTLPKGECVFVEMGTRRAFSKAWHREVTEYLANNLTNFGGTSNIGVAYDLGCPCVGTQAHEWFQAGQVLSPDITRTNEYMLNAWYKVYGNPDLNKMAYGIALTDCLTTDVFLREFNESLANKFDGCRHDSGDPLVWGDKLIAHYQRFGIDPRIKTIVFSNSLNPEMVFKIFNYFRGKFGKIVFGIGTDFSHDLGVKGLNMVMKMIEFDNLPVAKISDDQGKGMCEDQAYVNWLKAKNGIK